MKTGVTHLFIPGPTNVPDEVRRAMNVGHGGHARPGFRRPDAGPVFRPQARAAHRTGEVFIFPGSGTAAWEAAITNTLNPGDKVLMARFGQFSTLWVEMAQRLGLEVEVIDVAWGAGVPVAEFERGSAPTPRTRSRPSSSPTTRPRPASPPTSPPCAARSTPASTTRCCSSTASVPSRSIDFRMDEWGVDLAVTGSQKGLMCPAGLGILGVSRKAMEASRHATMRRAYFEFMDMVKMNADGYFPYTPPTPLLRGLRAALDRLFREGLDEVIARHARIAEGVRRGVHAWGLELVAEHPSLYSDTVSAIRTPQDVDARDVLRIAYDEMNTSFGSGLARLQGKVFRIGHLGDFNEGMALTALSIAEMALVRAGAQIQLGAGVAAAQRHFTGAAMANPVLRVAAE
jgi:alanine-glyoxylate transaminase/serine-glyoxylate transaminase/serine-pyruvate transaminase